MSDHSYESGQRFDVLVSEENEKSGKRWFTKVGSAFVNRDGSIGVRIVAGISITGNILIKEPYEKQADDQGNRGGGGYGRGNQGGGARRGGGGGQQQRRGNGPPRRVSQEDFDYDDGGGTSDAQT